MSVEDEKKPRKTPAKKATTAKKATPLKSVKAAPGTAKKASAKSANGVVQESVMATAVSQKSPTHGQIAEQAYHYFVARGRQHGFHEQDWHRAEQDLRSKRT